MITISLGSRLNAMAFRQADAELLRLGKTAIATDASTAGAFLRTGASLKRLGSSVNAVASSWGKYVALPVAAGLVLAAKAAMDQQKALAVLDLQTRKNTKATDAQVASVDAFIEGQSVLTGNMVTALIPAMGRLEIATKSRTKAEMLLKLAEDISAGTGKGLSVVAVALSRAYMGTTTSLGRLGIQTSVLGVSQDKVKTATIAVESAQAAYNKTMANSKSTSLQQTIALQKLQVAHEKLTKATTATTKTSLTFAQMLPNLEKAYGGDAAKAANTTAGSMLRLKASVHQLSVEFGDILLPFVEKGVDWLGKVDLWLTKLTPATRKWVVELGLAAVAMYPALKITGGLVNAGSGISTMLGMRALKAGIGASAGGAAGAGGGATGVGAGAAASVAVPVVLVAAPILAGIIAGALVQHAKTQRTPQQAAYLAKYGSYQKGRPFASSGTAEVSGLLASENKAVAHTAAEGLQIANMLGGLHKLAAKPFLVGDVLDPHTKAQLVAIRDTYVSQGKLTRKQADTVMTAMYGDWTKITAAQEKHLEAQAKVFRKLGLNLTTGLGAGVLAGTPDAVSTVRALAVGMTTEFASHVKSYSPSKVFFQQGTYITQGLQQGIEHGAKGPIGAIGRLGAQLAAKLSGYESKMARINSGSAFGNAAGGSGGSSNVVALIRQYAARYSLDPRAELAIAGQEGIGGGIGDNGTSFGPFQLHIGGKFPASIGGTAAQKEAWAMSSAGIGYAMASQARMAGGLTGRAAVNALANWEGSSNIAGEAARAWATYDQGGYLPVGASIAVNKTGHPEPVGKAIGGNTYVVNVNMPPGLLVSNYRDAARQMAPVLKVALRRIVAEEEKLT
jgi:hypothetical protein